MRPCASGEGPLSGLRAKLWDRNCLWFVIGPAESGHRAREGGLTALRIRDFKPAPTVDRKATLAVPPESTSTMPLPTLTEMIGSHVGKLQHHLWRQRDNRDRRPSSSGPFVLDLKLDAEATGGIDKTYG